MKKWPKTINVMGLSYAVEYLADMVEVDHGRHDAFWGQVDYHSRIIRLWVGEPDRVQQPADVMASLLHETIHAVLQANRWIRLWLKQADDEAKETFTDQIANVLADTLVRNGLVDLPDSAPKGARRK